MTENVFLGLGSNLGNKVAFLQQACDEIIQTIGVIIAKSALYETRSWGFDTEDSFLNQVIIVKTSLKPEELLLSIRHIENNLGRVRHFETGYTSRTIDIDILYYGSSIVFAEDLMIPHPRLEFRNFVLEPLAEIAPDFYHPVLQKSSQELLRDCTDNLDVRLYNAD